MIQLLGWYGYPHRLANSHATVSSCLFFYTQFEHGFANNHLFHAYYSIFYIYIYIYMYIYILRICIYIYICEWLIVIIHIIYVYIYISHNACYHLLNYTSMALSGHRISPPFFEPLRLAATALPDPWWSSAWTWRSLWCQASHKPVDSCGLDMIDMGVQPAMG